MLAARLTNDAVRDWAPGCKTCQKLGNIVGAHGPCEADGRCRKTERRTADSWCSPQLTDALAATHSMASNLTQPYPCDSHTCSPNSVCCGLDPNDNKYYCASHCSCANNTQSAGGWNIDASATPAFTA